MAINLRIQSFRKNNEAILFYDDSTIAKEGAERFGNGLCVGFSRAYNTLNGQYKNVKTFPDSLRCV